jgi:hypothetical protein
MEFRRALKALADGYKIRKSDWSPERYIVLDIYNGIVNEKKQDISTRELVDTDDWEITDMDFQSALTHMLGGRMVKRALKDSTNTFRFLNGELVCEDKEDNLKELRLFESDFTEDGWILL